MDRPKTGSCHIRSALANQRQYGSMPFLKANAFWPQTRQLSSPLNVESKGESLRRGKSPSRKHGWLPFLVQPIEPGKQPARKDGPMTMAFSPSGTPSPLKLTTAPFSFSKTLCMSDQSV